MTLFFFMPNLCSEQDVMIISSYYLENKKHNECMLNNKISGALQKCLIFPGPEDTSFILTFSIINVTFK